MSFRDIAPASIQEIIQNGLLERTFQEALVPLFLYDELAEVKPWGGQLGAQAILTRGGLIPPTTTPSTGSDATADSYGFEQYSIKMDQWGKSIDTNMAMSAMALASKFVEDNQKLGINAAESLNLIAQGALYNAYGKSQTWVTSASTTSTALVVNDATGFQFAVVNLPTTGSNPSEGLTGVAVPQLVPVSSSTPLDVTINGAANTVTGVDLATNTLTLGSAISATVDWAVVNPTGAVSYRPNGRATGAQLVSGDNATLALFMSATTRLQNMHVPMIGGAYTAHIPPDTIEELFQDPAFESAYRGRGDSPVYRDLALGRFAGIDWVVDTVTPNYTNPGGLTVFQPIVAGADVLIKGPFERMGDLVSEINSGSTVEVDMIGGVARILRAPLDRFGQVLSSTWSWIGGYGVGTDLLTGDGAAFKRAVMVEHV